MDRFPSIVGLAVLLAVLNHCVAGPSEGDVRLVPLNGTAASGGSAPSTGRLEVLHAGQWGTVCDDFFDYNDARVACRQLGFAGARRILSAAKDGHQWMGTGPIWLDDLECAGTEASLVQCMARVQQAWGDTNCGHDEDVALACQATAAEEGEVRLLAGREPNFGCVQILHEESWGTICSSTWDHASASVLCRQLGYPGVRAFIVNKTAAHVNMVENASLIDMGRVWVEQVQCAGTELKLAYCDLRYGPATCSHAQDVIVWCDAAGTGSTGGTKKLATWLIVTASVSGVLVIIILLLLARKIQLCRNGSPASGNTATNLESNQRQERVPTGVSPSSTIITNPEFDRDSTTTRTPTPDMMLDDKELLLEWMEKGQKAGAQPSSSTGGGTPPAAESTSTDSGGSSTTELFAASPGC